MPLLSKTFGKRTFEGVTAFNRPSYRHSIGPLFIPFGAINYFLNGNYMFRPILSFNFYKGIFFKHYRPKLGGGSAAVY
jgi:hypothetical protein